MELKEFIHKITRIRPVSGELTHEITKENDKYKLKLIDKDTADLIISREKLTEEEKEEYGDMSSVIFRATLDSKKNIIIIEHGFGIFTPANKWAVIFTAGFIGITITDIDDYLENNNENKKR